jgi:uncharacterized peroxidase-related enzyme
METGNDQDGKGKTMERLRTLDPSLATGKTRALFETIHDRFGMIPNFMRSMANSPAVLESYLLVDGALNQGLLSAKLRAQIALVIAEANQSSYCLAVHSAIGRTVGLSDEEIIDSRKGASPDSKVAAALGFAGQLVEKKGQVSLEDVYRLTRVGFSEAEIAEIVANVALNIFTNYFNLVAGTAADFPEPPSLSPNT